MKKFTKGCLVTALILFIIGCAFSVTFGMMGGFRQIDSLHGNRAFRILRFGNMGSYIFGYNGSWFGIWNEEDWYEDLEELEDLDEERWSGMNELVSGGSASKTNYRVNDISNIDIELGGENLIITESEDDYIWVGNNSGHNRVKYGKDGNTFKLYTKSGIRVWKNISHGNIYLHLPRGMTLDNIDLEVGAGKLDSIALEAHEIDLDIGAGEFVIDGMSAHEIYISVGAGKADIDSVKADEADISAGAGSIGIRDMDVGDLSLEVGMGSIAAEGKISGEADIECGMGSINMRLDGSETDYNYNLECAMGSVQIGGNKYSGLASERIVDNGSRVTFDVECAMGAVNIDFN